MKQAGENSNSLKMVFRNRPENEKIVRTTAAVFASVLDPTLEEISDFKTIKSLLNKMINGDEETPFVEMSETAEEELPVFPESKSRKVTYAEPLVVNNKGSVKVKNIRKNREF